MKEHISNDSFLGDTCNFQACEESTALQTWNVVASYDARLGEVLEIDGTQQRVAD